jgi:hypothetical protein
MVGICGASPIQLRQETNMNVIENCVDAVYCSEPVNEREILVIRRRLSTRPEFAATETDWQLELIDYDRDPNLSFIVAR